MRVLLLASYALSLTRFRARLVQELVAAGHEVVCCAPEDDPAVARELTGLGAAYLQVPLARTGTNPAADARSLVALVALFRRIRPDLVLGYTQKPVIYGSVAAKLAGVPRVAVLMTGLGYAFTEPPRGSREVKRLALRLLSRALYRAGLACADTVVFQNPDDLDDFRRMGLVRPRHRAAVVDGSGVDLEIFAQRPVPKGPPVFLLIARLLGDKGVPEFVEAARELRRRWPETRFWLLGPLDSNPGGIDASRLEAWSREGVIEYLGETLDVREHLAACSVFVLPTALREGVPRTVLEALATGRAVVTADAPGCRETVRNGWNGFLVPPRDAGALAAALERFAEDPALARAMGPRGRELAEERFDVRLVNRAMFEALGMDRADGASLPEGEGRRPAWA